MKVKGSVPGLMTLMAMPMKNVKGYFNLFFLTIFILDFFSIKYINNIQGCYLVDIGRKISQKQCMYSESLFIRPWLL